MQSQQGTRSDPELAVLCALTGAVDLDQDSDRRLVLSVIAAAGLDEDRLETYTRLSALLHPQRRGTPWRP